MLDFGVIKIDPEAGIYQTPPQRIAEKKACELGVTEAELIRRAIEAHLANGPLIGKDISAWEREKEFILSRVKKGTQEKGRQWRREELYERPL